MIEINLLPGGARKKAASSTRASIDYAAMFAGITARLGGSPWVIVAIVIGVLGAGAGGFMYFKGESDRTKAEGRLEQAQKDSLKQASIVKTRARLEAKRDTLLRQVNLIRSIDEDRFIWPHILDEVSRALPAFTWLTNISYAGTPAGSANVVALPKAPPRDTASKGVKMIILYGPSPDSVEEIVPRVKGDTTKLPPVFYRPKDGKISVPNTMLLPMINRGWSTTPTVIPKDDIVFRITGRTVDIQALTRFMNDLSLSPFLAGVDIEPVAQGTDLGKEMFQFTLKVNYRRPDTTVLRRVPLALTGR